MKNETNIEKCGFTSENTIVIAVKTPGRRKFHAAAFVKAGGGASHSYDLYRQQNGESGCCVNDLGGGQVAMSAAVTDYIFSLHGLTHDEALALAKEYAQKHYAGDESARQFRGVIGFQNPQDVGAAKAAIAKARGES